MSADTAVETAPAANGGQEFLYRAGGSMLLRQQQHDPQGTGGGAEAAQDREPRSDGSEGCARDKIQLRVEGMKCAKMCARHAATVLGAVPGVEAVDVHFDSKIATVRCGHGSPSGSAPGPCHSSEIQRPITVQQLVGGDTTWHNVAKPASAGYDVHEWVRGGGSIDTATLRGRRCY